MLAYIFINLVHPHVHIHSYECVLLWLPILILALSLLHDPSPSEMLENLQGLKFPTPHAQNFLSRWCRGIQNFCLCVWLQI